MRRCLIRTIAVAVIGAATALVALAAPLATRAAAATTAPATAAAPAAQQTASLAEDLAVLKALAPLGLSRSQLAQLLPSLRGAQARLAEFDARETEKLAAFRGSLEQAKRDLLAGKSSGTRAQEQFSTAQATSAGRRAGLRAELVAGLRRTLDTILTPQQAGQMAQNGHAVLFSQRTATFGAGRGGNPGGGGPGGGGPGGRMTDRLDRVRQMSPADFQQEADRMADRMGGQNSPQFQQFVSQMNSIRNMPHSQYLLQRDQLAMQSMGRGGFGAALGGTTDESTNAFVDRYLLSPRAPTVLADRLSTPVANRSGGQ
jgi:hypothetical protein